ncbi:MarR family winged helix-turn-helix transcriptional regulator [Gordonia sp. (in: high G+C Gram-positive bacteria)]|uniref:MarR family winged helix-turn-helix transcriptional regulator n=1 Tax=Gordonia sp. (in: high G+C Gram-positive bacteria) TaxID=84139 RepID=UPI0035B4267F
MNLVDGGWALFARVNDESAKQGLSVSDLRILEAVCINRQLSVSEVTDAVHMRVSTVSRMIGRLSDDGNIHRFESKADGRHRLVRLTDHGRRTLAIHVHARDQVIRQFVVDAMTPEEFTALGVAFRKIREAVDAAEPAATD